MHAPDAFTSLPRPRPGHPGGRWRADHQPLTLRDFEPDDRATLARLYESLQAIHGLARDHLHAPASGLDALRELLVELDFIDLVDEVSGLGLSTAARAAPPALRKALHDIRGGSLVGLVMHLDLVLEGEGVAADLERCFVLARDHLKICRHAIPSLDPTGHAEDLRPKAHPASLLVEKWGATTWTAGEHRVRVALDARFDGVVSECCFEFAALDRVIYNLVNNAARYAADGAVLLRTEAIEAADATHMRVCVANRVEPHQAEALRARFGDRPDALFQGGFTTGGTGLGLRIVADIVTHGYGLHDLDEALARAVLGAEVRDGWFIVWFCWPATP